uniref:Delta(14)-sterol reductase TM7SF2 n=1 Tax=Marmota marmota marmota TaxID=9994 RepID=A0A8C5Z289_MARMA
RFSRTPSEHQFEFGGLIGALGISIGLPNFDIVELWNGIKPLRYYLGNRELWTVYCLWYGILAVLDVILPGRVMKGVQLRDGSKLSYKINGIAMSTTLVLVLAIRWKLTDGQLPELQYLYENHVSLCIISILFSFFLATEKILALGGNSGNIIYDWFIGRELNPRLGPLDIKMFSELRPGMLLWLLINLSCLHHHYLKTGKINDALVLVNFLQGFYIFDGVLNEEGVLTMMDITTDGFGFMLAFGDLSLVPFTYSLQARYLSVSPVELGWVKVVGILAIMFLGFHIFHSANKQKSEFRQGKLENLKSIQTKRGTKLLCDGWWAKSQHINYFGDWLISLSWCLATWFQTPLTYYYSLYFATLLLHRQQLSKFVTLTFIDNCKSK